MHCMPQVGVFTMGEAGLQRVENPSALFLSDRSNSPAVSSAVTVTMEGTRPLLLEIQALTSPVHQVCFSAPKTFAEGIKLQHVGHLLLGSKGQRSHATPSVQGWKPDSKSQCNSICNSRHFQGIVSLALTATEVFICSEVTPDFNVGPRGTAARPQWP